jgi:hypothetical protein
VTFVKFFNVSLILLDLVFLFLSISIHVYMHLRPGIIIHQVQDKGLLYFLNVELHNHSYALNRNKKYLLVTNSKEKRGGKGHSSLVLLQVKSQVAS